MEDFVGFIAVLMIIAVIVGGSYLTGVATATRDERGLVCKMLGYDEYLSSLESCFDEDAGMLYAYEAVFARVE
jgi:hypothetical protein